MRPTAAATVSAATTPPTSQPQQTPQSPEQAATPTPMAPMVRFCRVHSLCTGASAHDRQEASQWIWWPTDAKWPTGLLPVNTSSPPHALHAPPHPRRSAADGFIDLTWQASVTGPVRLRCADCD